MVLKFGVKLRVGMDLLLGFVMVFKPLYNRRVERIMEFFSEFVVCNVVPVVITAPESGKS